MNKRKRGTFGTVSSMMVFVAAMLALYFILVSQPQKDTEEKIPTTEIDKLLVKDLENEYPQYPVDVIKLYGRYSRCLYNEPLSNEYLEKMVDQMRMLFASDFLDVNSRESQLDKLSEERKAYKKINRKLSDYTVQKSTETQYGTVDSKETASIGASILITDNNGYEKIYQRFLLRKEDGRWKIFAFKNVDSMDIGED